MSAPPTLIVNGRELDVSDSPPHESVLDLLRRHGLTGTKCGCNEGDCGACTVLLHRADGAPRAINSCLAFVHSLSGCGIVTAEGLGGEHPAQRSMIAGCGSQCGYCTPGFICSLAEASARGVTADADAVADQLCGNLCRCTGYRPIREAAAKTDTAPTPFEGIEGTRAATPHFHHPDSVAAALDLKSRHPSALFVAGATEIAVLVNKRHLRPEQMISLEQVAELRRIDCDESHWSIGAAVPLTDLAEALDGEYPAIDRMLRWFASRQIRHRATLGGNLVTASPIGDSAPVLLALDASLVIASREGRRTVPLAEFFTGYRKTSLAPDELLETVLLPRGLQGRTAFFKVSKRREMDISAVSAAFRIATGENGRITEARLAYGGVSAFPQRAAEVESSLIGLTLAEAAGGSVLEKLGGAFSPISDLRGSAGYRRELVRGLFLKFLLDTESDAISDPVLRDPEEHSPVSLVHESARGHVTGTAGYTGDLAIRRGALQVWLVRSKVAHARILEIDVQAALAMPGVRAVLTAKDIPGSNNTGPSRPGARRRGGGNAGAGAARGGAGHHLLRGAASAVRDRGRDCRRLLPHRAALSHQRGCFEVRSGTQNRRQIIHRRTGAVLSGNPGRARRAGWRGRCPRSFLHAASERDPDDCRRGARLAEAPGGGGMPAHGRRVRRQGNPGQPVGGDLRACGDGDGSPCRDATRPRP